MIENPDVWQIILKRKYGSNPYSLFRLCIFSAGAG